MESSVLSDKSNGIATLYLNEPKSRNALSQRLKEELKESLIEAERDRSIKVVIIASKGEVFCAGGDIKAMSQKKYDALEIKKIMDDSSGIIEIIREMSKITISAVNGFAAGAGISLALATDLMVAEEDTKFLLSFKNVGLIPDLGLHYYLSRAVGERRAKEWIWNGKTISVEEAQNAGFVNEIASKGEAIQKALELGNKLNEGPIQSYIFSKLLINSSSISRFEDVLLKENDLQCILRGTYNHQEGLKAFFEKRKPIFIN